MELYDSFGPFRQGLAGLGQSLADYGNAQRNEGRQKLNDELLRLKLSEAKQEMSDKEGLRSTLANLQPTVETSVVDNRQNALSNLPFPNNKPDFQLKETEVPPNYERAAFDYYRKTDPEKATQMYGMITDKASKIASMGDHEQAVNYFNAATGSNLKYQGSKDDLIKLESNGKIFLYNWRTKDMQEFGSSKQFSDPYETTVGGKKIMVQKNANTGELKRVGEDVSTTVKVNVGHGAGKPMPASALKLQQEEVDAVSTASNIATDLQALRKQVEGGEIDLGLISNLANRGRNWVGLSTPESRNYTTFKATLERMRNDSLRLNKGVQTEGDAQRAWNELFENLNDSGVVKQRLSEIERINERASDLHKMNIDNIRSNYGLPPLDTSKQGNPEPAVGQGNSEQIRPREPKTVIKPPKQGAKIPRNIAQKYMDQYGNAAAAREAAKKDGWSF